VYEGDVLGRSRVGECGDRFGDPVGGRTGTERNEETQGEHASRGERYWWKIVSDRPTPFSCEGAFQQARIIAIRA
jgi:hypothetical protein